MKTTLTALCLLAVASGASAAPPPPPAVTAFAFQGVTYLHRWSQKGQNEFTPRGQEDLEKWTDMVTINVPDGVQTGETLAGLANRVLGLYQSTGRILRTDSRPQTKEHEAEHLVVGILGNPGYLEAAFARFLIRDGQGLVVVYSHRVYGAAAGDGMSAWLEKNGDASEKALMAWGDVPAPAALRALPQAP